MALKTDLVTTFLIFLVYDFLRFFCNFYDFLKFSYVILAGYYAIWVRGISEQTAKKICNYQNLDAFVWKIVL